MIKTKTLKNGIRLVTESLPEAQAAAIGIFVGAGSAYETPEISGVSHYIEHMFFKGTENRTYKQIAEDMDRFGAQFNAFTGKEYTCFHAKALTNVFPNVCDILFDMLTGSLFDEKEMKKERSVIQEEMRMVEDIPEDAIIDYLSESMLSPADVANNILGTRKSLKSITRDTILEYIEKQYTKDSIVIAVVGKFNEKKLIEQIDQSFKNFKDKKNHKRITEYIYKPKYISKARDINQSHIALGLPTESFTSKDYYTELIVQEALGGGMSSRLFQNIREEKGLCYTIYSAPLAYSYTGILLIYAAVTIGKEAEAIKGISEELSKISLTQEEIDNIKQRIKANYIFSMERLDSRMLRYGRNSLLLGKVSTEEEIIKKLDAVTKKQIDDFCEKISDIKNYSCTIISKNKLNVKKLINE